MLKEFLKDNYKILVVIFFILILVLVLLFVNMNKKSKIPEVIPVEYNYFSMYSTDDKVGVIDKKGNLIIDAKYFDIYIPNPSKDVFVCFETDDEYVILNSKGEELFKDFEGVEVMETLESNLDFEKTFLKFKKNGKYGLIDYNGKEIVSAQYDNVQSLKNRPGEILVKKDSKYGVLDSLGNLKIKLEYDSIVGDEYCTEKYGYGQTGYIVMKKTKSGNMYGYLDYTGEQYLKTEFESITRVFKYDDDNIYLIAMSNGKKGVYKNKEEIIEKKYQNITFADNSDLFVVKRNSKYGIYNMNGKLILDTKYTNYSLAEKYISVTTTDDKKELYDVNGNKLSSLDYVTIQPSGNTDCYIAIDEDGYYSIISKTDKYEDNYTYISFAFDNYFIFKNEEGYYGLLNIYSGIVIEPEYTFMLVVDGKRAIEAEKLDGTVDIYSKDIEKVLTINNAVLEKINEDYTVIYSNSEMAYINKDGKKVENVEVFDNNKLYAYSQNSKWGFKNKQGNVVVEAKYDFVTEIDTYGFAGILKDGKWGVIDETGKVIVEPSYEIDNYYLPKFVGKYLLDFKDNYFCLELE